MAVGDRKRAQAERERKEWLEDFEQRETPDLVLTPEQVEAAKQASAGAGGTKGAKAAGGAAKDRAPRRPAGSSRRPASGRRLARRIARETPGVPGPSATNLVLSFLGTTVLVIGLVLLVSNGDRLGFIPGWIGTAAGRLTDPTDPLF